MRTVPSDDRAAPCPRSGALQDEQGRHDRASISAPELVRLRDARRQADVLANKKASESSFGVAFHDAGKIEVGNSAKARIILAPSTRFRREALDRPVLLQARRSAGRAVCKYESCRARHHRVRIKIREEEFCVPEISAFVLKEMRRSRRARSGRPVRAP